MDFGQLIEKVLQSVAPYEFRTFVIGFDRPEEYDRVKHEAMFRELKRSLGEEISKRLPGVDADFMRPDLRIEIGIDHEVRLQPAPIFLGGRYRKLSREIPATRWIHHACGGRGCASCGHTGNLCGPSIQELLSGPALKLSGGERTAFHGLGREDTDARMLGLGRPFVLEVHRPRRRSIRLDACLEAFSENARGLAEVVSLVMVGPEARGAVKTAECEKTYRAWVEIGDAFPPAALKRVAGLTGATVDQASPSRVQHRRGKTTHRLRRIVESSWLGEIEGRHVWEVRVEAGMYVKELVSGDGGRTRPSLSEVLGLPCRCAALDVLEIHWNPPWE